jgi:hypothetical protein
MLVPTFCTKHFSIRRKILTHRLSAVGISFFSSKNILPIQNKSVLLHSFWKGFCLWKNKLFQRIIRHSPLPEKSIGKIKDNLKQKTFFAQ